MNPDDIPKPEILNQPGYSFLATNYNLLYQCIMPNCRVTIANIRKHCDLSDEVEKEILKSTCARLRCQQLLNVMLEILNADKDYMKFCYLLFLSTVATDLSCYMISKFQSDRHWDSTAKVHPELEALYLKYQADHDRVHKSNSLSAVTIADQDELACDANTSVDFEAAFVDRAEKLAGSCKIGNRICKRQRIHSFQQEMGVHDSIMHSNVHQLDSQLDTTSNLNNADDASQNDTLLQSSLYILDASNGNDNPNTSTVLQSDIVPESHDLITSVSNISEINAESESNTSSHPSTNNIHSHTESADDVNHDQSTGEPSLVPEILNTNQDLQILKHKYAVLLQKFPETYLLTLECLQDYLTDDCICVVLESSNADTANKLMLDCMISKLTCKENLLDFFDQLEEITGEHNLASTINELRQELQDALESTNSGIQQPITPNGIVSTLELKSWFLTQTTLSDHCKGLLKRHYQALCNSLPEDVTKTKARLLQYSRVLPSCAIEKITPTTNSEIVNQKIINFLIISCKDDNEIIHFCDLFEKLVENPFFIRNVEILRNDFLTLDYTKPHEQAIEFTTRNLSLNDQTPILNEQQRSEHIQSEQSTAENNGTQDTAAPTGGSASIGHLANQLNYTQGRLEQGLVCFEPPTKPPVLIDRKVLLDKLATAVVTSNLNPNNCNPTVIVTGAGGFGKTTLITAVCYHKIVTEHFTDGFLFIEIGPQPIDPASQLHQLYSRLTGGKSFPRGSLRNLVEGVRSFTYKYYRNLLVLIDDVWEFEDVEPILTAFSSCKTILTSRKIELISSEEHITVDAMTDLEAVDLLTDQLVDVNSLSENTRKLITDLAQDLLLWPLLLFLVRGHIWRNQRLYSHSFEKTIQEVQIELYRNGLTAFDKNCFEKSKGRKVAIKACVEVSLDFLLSQEKDRLITLILYTGIGGSVPMSVLHLLWKVSKEDGKACLEKLWSYGLVMSKQLLIPPQNNIQVCAEVHCTVSTYIINSLSSAEVVRLSELCEGVKDVVEALTNAFIQCYGSHPSQLDGVKFLEYWKIRLEHDVLPFYLRRINMCAVIDPHKIIWLMDQILEALQQIPQMFQVLAELANEFYTIGKESKMLFKKTTKSSQKLYQVIAKHMYESDYKGAVSALQSYCRNYEIGKVASKSLELCGKVISKFGGPVHFFFVQKYQQLLMLTPEYHGVTGTTIVLARIELHIDLYKQIINALESKSASQIQGINEYIKSGNFHEEEDLVNIHHLIKLKRVVPDFGT